MCTDTGEHITDTLCIAHQYYIEKTINIVSQQNHPESSPWNVDQWDNIENIVWTDMVSIWNVFRYETNCVLHKYVLATFVITFFQFPQSLAMTFQFLFWSITTLTMLTIIMHYNTIPLVPVLHRHEISLTFFFIILNTYCYMLLVHLSIVFHWIGD